MKTLSIELVPRGADQLEEECLAIRRSFPQLQVANIPDLLRMPLRSWEACRVVRRFFPRVIPHLRACDFAFDHADKIANAVHGFSEVLVVSGDPPKDFSRISYATTSVDLIAFLKREFPSLRVYAGVDPYRNGPRTELDYLKRKSDAGADAFFTQPFFCHHLLNTFRDLLAPFEVYWGLSPVLGLKSRSYWESTNRAIFSPSFEPTLEYNQTFARDVLQRIAGDSRSHAYLMPIRTDVVKYLDGIFNERSQNQLHR